MLFFSFHKKTISRSRYASKVALFAQDLSEIIWLILNLTKITIIPSSAVIVTA
jgi:hypothetical protein